MSELDLQWPYVDSIGLLPQLVPHFRKTTIATKNKQTNKQRQKRKKKKKVAKCFVQVINFIVFMQSNYPYSLALLHPHQGNWVIAPVSRREYWRIWVKSPVNKQQARNAHIILGRYPIYIVSGMRNVLRSKILTTFNKNHLVLDVIWYFARSSIEVLLECVIIVRLNNWTEYVHALMK